MVGINSVQKQVQKQNNSTELKHFRDLNTRGLLLYISQHLNCTTIRFSNENKNHALLVFQILSSFQYQAIGTSRALSQI